MARQMSIDGTERKHIKEIGVAGRDYVDKRDTRMGWTEKEKESKDLLIKVMKKHRTDIYVDDDAVPPLRMVLKETDAKTDVKVEVISSTDKEPKAKKAAKKKALPAGEVRDGE